MFTVREERDASCLTKPEYCKIDMCRIEYVSQTTYTTAKYSVSTYQNSPQSLSKLIVGRSNAASNIAFFFIRRASRR